MAGTYPQDILWIQRDRTTIRLGDMSDSHLANAIRMCRRIADKHMTEMGAAYSYPGNPDGMGAYYADQAGHEAGDKMLQWSRAAETLLDELRRRYPNERIVIRRDEQRLPRRCL